MSGEIHRPAIDGGRKPTQPPPKPHDSRSHARSQRHAQLANALRGQIYVEGCADAALALFDEWSADERRRIRQAIEARRTEMLERADSAATRDFSALAAEYAAREDEWLLALIGEEPT